MQGCDGRSLPLGLTDGRSTPTFTRESTPPALLDDHLTSAWAELVVSAGTVVFVEPEPPHRCTVEAGERHVIEPGRPHRVEPGPDARFFVQFHVETTS